MFLPTIMTVTCIDDIVILKIILSVLTASLCHGLTQDSAPVSSSGVKRYVLQASTILGIEARATKAFAVRSLLESRPRAHEEGTAPRGRML